MTRRTTPAKALALAGAAALAIMLITHAATTVRPSATLRVDDGTVEIQRSDDSLSITQSGDSMSSGIQLITTNAATLSVHPAVGTPGYSWFRNTGSYDVYLTNVTVRIPASGGLAMFVPQTNTISAVLNSSAGANSATLSYFIVEQ